VFNSSLNKEDKLILLALNNVNGWLVYDKDEIEIYERKGKDVEKRTVKVLEFHKKLARKIFKHLLGKNKRPRFNNISMHLEGKVGGYYGTSHTSIRAHAGVISIST
jgi:putative transposase